jgi:catalase (peroxidase I)
VNAGLDSALGSLAATKDKYGEGLSWADLIVLAGTVAAEGSISADAKMDFCGGRTDASNGEASATLLPIVTGEGTDTAYMMREAFTVTY